MGQDECKGKMKKTFDLISMGEILLRLSSVNNERLDNGEVFSKQVGGAELNVSTGVALLGMRTAIISKIPKNRLGKYMKNRIRFCGVSDDLLQYDSDIDARLGIYYYENGAYPRKPEVVYDRQNTSIHKLTIDAIDEDIYSKTRIFHTSGISIALSEEVKDTAVEVMKRFKKAGALISFDVNFRSNLWSEVVSETILKEVLPLVDIFFCSQLTANLTFGKKGTIKTIMKDFANEFNISIIASTNRIVHSPKIHTFDSILYDFKKDKFYKEEPYHNIEVIDRIGSGDAYVSGVLFALLKFEMDGERAVSFGNAAAAIKNTILGDMPSSDYVEILQIIEEHKDNRIQSEMNR